MNMNGVKRIAQISTARRSVIRLETTKVFTLAEFKHTPSHSKH